MEYSNSGYFGKVGDVIRNLSLNVDKVYIKDLYDDGNLYARELRIVANNGNGNIFFVRFRNNTAGFQELTEIDSASHGTVPKLGVGSIFNISRAKIHYQGEYNGIKTNYLNYVKVGK